MKNLLLSKKIRITDFRVAILAIFERFDAAISVEQIEKELGVFDRITLYRTLRLFKEKGIIHEITIAGNTLKLALCAQHCEQNEHHHNHIHFHCESCDEVYCVDIEKFPEIGLNGFKIKELEIQASGICQRCN